MTIKVRRALAGLAVMAVAVAPAMHAAAQSPPTFPKATFADQGASVDRVTAGVHMTYEDTAPTRGYAGPTSMEVNPEDPTIIAAATANLRTRTCRLLVSTNAGQSWRFSEEDPAPADYSMCTNTTAGVAQSSLAWGSNNTLYYAMEAYGEGEGPAPGTTSIALARTQNLGATWRTTMVTDARAEPDPKPENTGVMGLAVDTSGDEDVIYVGFSRDWRSTAPEGHPLENSRPVMVATSTDGGDTFAEAVNLNDHSTVTATYQGITYPLHFQTAFGRPYVAAHDGVVLAVGDGGPPQGEPPNDEFGGIFGEALPLLVARSTDNGQTWDVSELGPPVYNGAGSHTGMGWTPEGGPEGTWVFAYSATPENAPSAGQADIVVQRSTDNGLTWSDPVAINDDDPSDQYTSFYPQLDVAPNGRVDVVFQTNRDQVDYRMAVMYTYSTDAGATWAPNMEVTDRPVNFNLGISYNSDIRQPPGVASTDEYAAIAWADTRLGDEESQTQDNFGVVAQFDAISTGDDEAWPYLAAVFAGLVLAGLALFGVMTMRKS